MGDVVFLSKEVVTLKQHNFIVNLFRKALTLSLQEENNNLQSSQWMEIFEQSFWNSSQSVMMKISADQDDNVFRSKKHDDDKLEDKSLLSVNSTMG